MQWTIVADSGCDLLPAQLAPNISYRRVPLTIQFGMDSWIDVPTMDASRLLDAMEAYKGKSSSACPSVDVWESEFSAEGCVIAITITGGMSGSYNSAVCARDMIWEKQPDKPIFVLDSRSAGPELALLVMKACALIQQGLDFEAVVERLKAYHQHTHLLFMLEHVDNFVKNGRLNKLVGATIGVLGIRIVGCASEQGTLQPLHKQRSLSKCHALFVDEMEARGYAGGELAITHVGGPEGANKLLAAVRKRWPDAPCRFLSASGLCSYYGERNGLLLAFEDKDA